MPFSFCLPFLLFTLFRQELKKKTLHNIFAFNNNGPRIDHIVEKKTNHKRKKK